MAAVTPHALTLRCCRIRFVFIRPATLTRKSRASEGFSIAPEPAEPYPALGPSITVSRHRNDLTGIEITAIS